MLTVVAWKEEKEIKRQAPPRLLTESRGRRGRVDLVSLLPPPPVENLTMTRVTWILWKELFLAEVNQMWESPSSQFRVTNPNAEFIVLISDL
jgi:hypothetical protein